MFFVYRHHCLGYTIGIFLLGTFIPGGAREEKGVSVVA